MPTNAKASERHRQSPPTILSGTTIKGSIKLMAKISVEQTEYKLRQVNPSNNITVICSKLETYLKISSELKQRNQKFYSYTPKELKPKSLILKGVNGGYTVDDIKKELIVLKIPNIEIINVSEIKFKTKRGQEVQHHLVQVSNNSVTIDLMKVNPMLQQIVKWENLRKKIVIQCRNC